MPTIEEQKFLAYHAVGVATETGVKPYERLGNAPGDKSGFSIGVMQTDFGAHPDKATAYYAALNGGQGNDIVRGHRGEDVVLGGSGDDLVEGGLGDDSLNGGTGNDALRGGQGDDSIDGGDGTDVIELSGSYADYRITHTSAGMWIADNTAGRDGTDFVSNAEKVNFRDVSLVDLDLVNPMPVPG